MKNNLILKRIVMKSFAILLLTIVTGSILLAHETEGQGLDEVMVSLQVKNSSVKRVLEELHERTDFNFLYNEKDIRSLNRISIQVASGNLEDVLFEISKQTGLTFRRVNENIAVHLKEQQKQIVKNPESAVNKNITGKVVDKDGNPLPGVSIIIKGTLQGTITDLQGNYSLENVPQDAVIVFSYVGMKTQEITDLDGRTSLDIVMEEDLVGLEEVIAIGYGNIKRSDLTGSVSSVSSDELVKIPVTNINSALQGRATGVSIRQNQTSPGGDVQMRIRGINSFMGNNNPLYVIDGIVGADLGTINPSDIQSIEILKDASSTAIYGTKGANGVVLITTKSGEGIKNTISFDSYVSRQSVTRKLDMLEAREWAEIDNERSVLLGFEPIWDLNNLPADTDWFDEIFQSSLMQNYNLSATGGDKINYFASANYLKQDGVVINTDYERYNFRLNLDSEINKYITLGSRFGISRTIRNSMFEENNYNRVGTMDAAYQAPPILSPYDENGKLKPSVGYMTASGSWEEITNPIHFQKNLTDISRGTALSGNLFADIKLVKGFYFRPSFNYTVTSGKNGYYNSNEMWVDTYDFRSEARVGSYDANSWNTDMLLNYERVFDGKHQISLLGGFVATSASREDMSARVYDFGLDVFDYHQLTAGETLDMVNSGLTERKSLSVISRINYIFQNKYYFTFNSRYDGSSVLGPENKWGYFPSGAIMWKLSREEFMDNLNVFYDLTLRASYGITGSEALGPYASHGKVGSPTGGRGSWYNINGTPVVGYKTTALAVPDLRWEETTMLDLGMEAAIFNGRLRFVLDYYQKSTENLFLQLPVPTTSGVNTITKNAGSLKNSGVEIDLSAVISDASFRWKSSFNIAFQQQEVTDLAGLEEIFMGVRISGSPGNNFRVSEGEPLGTFFGYVEDGLWQIDELTGLEDDQIPTQWGAAVKPGDVKYVDLNGDGLVDVDDRKVIGHALPKFFGGWNNTFSYKGFDASIFLDYIYGNDLYNAENFRTMHVGTGSLGKREEFKDYWTPENPDAFIPALNSNTGQRFSAKRYLEDGSFLRLKEATLGYSLSTNAIANIRIYVSGTNLFTWTKATISNPESNLAAPSAGGSSQDVGVFNVGYGGYPYYRTFTLGVNLTF